MILPTHLWTRWEYCLSWFVLLLSWDFCFSIKPIRLLIEKQPKEAVAYFLKTLGIFSIITIGILTVVSLQ